MEPGHGLHENQRRLQALLRRANGNTAPRHGRHEIPERVRPHRSRAGTRRTAPVEKTSARVRELDERPVPRLRPYRLHPVGVPRHESGIAAHVSGADETPCSRHGPRSRTELDAEYLARREHRIRSVAQPRGETDTRRRPREIPVSRTVAGAVARPGFGRNRLGDRRRRIRARCPAHEGGVGAGHPRPVPATRRPVFL